MYSMLCVVSLLFAIVLYFNGDTNWQLLDFSLTLRIDCIYVTRHVTHDVTRTDTEAIHRQVSIVTVNRYH